mgnify:CR=1 FL=1
MTLFGRKDEAGDPQVAIAAFWAWWEQGRAEVERLLEAGDMVGLTELLGPKVTAIHPELVWEIVPGRQAAQALVVTAAGAPDVRPLAHRWVRMAPPADEEWEFHPSRQANPDLAEVRLQVAGRDFGLDRLVLGLRAPRGNPRVDVAVFHPIFPDLEEEARQEAALLALDWLIGEDEVARWVGEITAAAAEPIDAVPAVHLPAVIADQARYFAEREWVELEGRSPSGAKLTAATLFPLRPVDHPLYDRHITITLPYREADADGLPTGASVKALDEFTERLSAGLRDALLTVHVSGEGTRVLHVYADPGDDAEQVARALAETWPEGPARVETEDDPGWITISSFLS